MTRLSPRLSMILSLVPEAESCCDIGTDHGYIAAALSRRCRQVIAMDVNKGPLAKAEKNMLRYGIKNVELRLSDGFAALSEGEADCAVIAGMGGELIVRLISNGIKGTKCLVLQPQSQIYELRDYLSGNGFSIDDEAVCKEGRRFYVAMLVRPGEAGELTEAEKRIGPVLLKKRPPLLGEYLEDEVRKLTLALEKIERSGADTPNISEYHRLIDLYGGMING